jgi:hypothetical protein
VLIDEDGVHRVVTQAGGLERPREPGSAIRSNGRLGVTQLGSTGDFGQRVVHGLSVLSGQGNHFVSARRCAADPKAAITLGDESTGDPVKDLVERLEFRP